MKRPDAVKRSREEGEAWIKRLEDDALTAADRRGLVLGLQVSLWLLLAFQEAKCSLKRLRVLWCGDQPKQRKEPSPEQAAGSRGDEGGSGGTAGVAQARGDSPQGEADPRRPGQGRWGAEASRGAAQAECRQEALAVGARCPVWGLGRLDRVPVRGRQTGRRAGAVSGP